MLNCNVVAQQIRYLSVSGFEAEFLNSNKFQKSGDTYRVVPASFKIRLNKDTSFIFLILNNIKRQFPRCEIIVSPDSTDLNVNEITQIFINTFIPFKPDSFIINAWAFNYSEFSKDFYCNRAGYESRPEDNTILVLRVRFFDNKKIRLITDFLKNQSMPNFIKDSFVYHTLIKYRQSELLIINSISCPKGGIVYDLIIDNLSK